jgi:putative hydrolase of the HAD superfamily
VIRAVCFDVDGVLVPPWRFRDLLAREHAITPQMTAPFFRGPFVACVEGRAELEHALAPYLESWLWKGTPAEFIELWLDAENALDTDVLEIAAELRRSGMPCFLASVQERRRARYLIDDMGLGRRFDGSFFSCDLGRRKSDVGYFAEIARRSGHPPASLLLIDDTPSCVDTARAAGWQAVQFTSGATLRAELARLGLGLDGS